MALRGVGHFHNHGLAGIGWRWWALVGAPPPLTPEKAGLEAIWCEVLRKMLRNTPVYAAQSEVSQSFVGSEKLFKKSAGSN
ncbi:hypothetical protein AY554_01060 [Corynebacterium diphtheriae bv. gravis]|uniref:hypothetical protein n=1 Tax=Corynebacterium diphtheriae TaxID=1717 RepID=UPI000B715921|nr:hypothetical protein [Corynebacterium diphtheriae]OWO50752.1 hypothetical protein AY554_01060 [Corynebacterium diphtheriae bv. gravis]